METRKPRIAITDTPAAAVLKLADGHDGAAVACTVLVKAMPSLDPQAEFGPFTPLLMLDSFGLHGAVIWRLFDGLCGRDALRTLAVLHAVRLKIIHSAAVRDALLGRGTPLDLDHLVGEVKTHYPGFARTQS